MAKHSTPKLGMMIPFVLASCMGLSACGGGGDAPEAVPGAVPLVDQLSAAAAPAASVAAEAEPGSAASVLQVGPSGAIAEPAAEIEPITAPSTAAAALSFALDSVATASEGTASDKQESLSTASATSSSIRSADVLSEASTALALKQQRWGSECYGMSQDAKSLPDSGVVGSQVSGTPAMRLGIEAPPNSPNRTGIVLRTVSGDPEASGPRCEIAFWPTATSYLPKASTFWFVSTVWLDDWRSTTDEQLVMQFHDGDWSRGLNPFFALLIKGNQARLNVRWDSTQTQTVAKTNVLNKDIWSGSFDFSQRWVTFVVQARTSTRSADAPFMKVWRDGQLIANYSGPLGYNQTGFKDYAKVGYYHWLSGNAWDQRMPVRTVYVRRAAVITDATGRYTEASIRANADQ